MTRLLALGHYVWIVPVLLGFLFLGAGSYMMWEGVEARNLVRDELRAEQITTSESASIPGVLVDDVSTARAQEAVLTEHTRGEYGPYSGMERDDPNRETYVTGVTLRNALNLAVMGFKVSDLVVGIGAFIVVLGLSNILFFAPVMYFVGNPEVASRQVLGGMREPVGAPATTRI